MPIERTLLLSARSTGWQLAQLARSREYAVCGMCVSMFSDQKCQSHIIPYNLHFDIFNRGQRAQRTHANNSKLLETKRTVCNKEMSTVRSIFMCGRYAQFGWHFFCSSSGLKCCKMQKTRRSKPPAQYISQLPVPSMYNAYREVSTNFSSAYARSRARALFSVWILFYLEPVCV